MRTYRDLENIKIVRPVVTVGIFDGIHTGHDTILERIKIIAGAIKGESTVVTFWPHPRIFLTPEGVGLKFLSTIREKRELLENKEIDNLVIIPFTREFSNLSAGEFITKILFEKIRASHLVVGYNHHFGKDREGNFEILEEIATGKNIKTEQVGAKILNNREVSSTLIRDALYSGDLNLANQMLGYTYFFNGKIIGGKKIGRSIGFPTANIMPLERYKLIPRDGVYAVKIELGSRKFEGMLNIGLRPTMNDVENGKTIEVHIFDFNQQIYGQEVKIFFIDRIRDEKKFSDVSLLAEQLKKDRERIREILSSNRE